MNMRFSVIVVSLNAGEELVKTVNSVLSQTFGSYELIVKDGGSTDGSTALLPADPRINLYVQEDNSIYDAMNQAVEKCRGDHIIFMNCGDYFYDEYVLARMAKEMIKAKADIYYGDLYRRKLGSTDIAPDKITDFVLYRNVPCHQVCFYSRDLFVKRAYRTSYKVRADYEHFLYCVKEEKAVCRHVGITVCSYEGEGFSETEENRKRSAEEHKEICEKYLGKKARIYRVLMILTLQPLREKLAGDPLFSSFYHRLKGRLYGKK